MEASSDFSQEQLAILSRAPLLERFLDKSAERDPQIYYPMLLEELKPVAEQLQEKFGRNLFNLGIYPQVMNAATLEIFSQGTSFEDTVGLVNIITAIGYQVGEPKDLRLFRNQILFQLAATGTVAPEDDQKISVIEDTIWGMLCSGSYWRHVSANVISQNQDIPDSFKDFIDKNEKFQKPL